VGLVSILIPDPSKPPDRYSNATRTCPFFCDVFLSAPQIQVHEFLLRLRDVTQTSQVVRNHTRNRALRLSAYIHGANFWLLSMGLVSDKNLARDFEGCRRVWNISLVPKTTELRSGVVSCHLSSKSGCSFTYPKSTLFSSPCQFTSLLNSAK
jgi:hypothetical protein